MENKKITDAKPVSKWMMVLTVIIFYVECALYLLMFKEMPEMDNVVVMVLIAAVPVIAFTPVYLNIFVDKFIKKG